MQKSLSLLSALPCWFKPAVTNGPAKMLLTQIGANKSRGKDARMFSSLISFFAPFSIFYIPHNYVIPQAMPHAIPQTHSAFYPHRCIRRYFFPSRAKEAKKQEKKEKK